MSFDLRTHLQQGQVIPALPLALDDRGRWSQRHQKALLRYYHEAGAGGLAVGVHSTQFAIREPQHALFEPLLELAGRELDALQQAAPRDFVRIAGLCGDTAAARAEAAVALRHGYHAGLLSMTAVAARTENEILSHCREVAADIPLIGFYLQPAVGGRVFSFDFWRRFVEIDRLLAIKIAPFNRYQSWDVIRAGRDSGRTDLALYTGNDDHIILDLLTPFDGGRRFISGGLLGQWGVWTRRAVDLLEEIKQARSQPTIAIDWLERNTALTDANAVIFDSAHAFAGCIPGIMEVLRRQGLVPSNRCLNPEEVLSPGQAEELDRIHAEYPELTDDDFVRRNLDRWLNQP